MKDSEFFFRRMLRMKAVHKMKYACLLESRWFVSLEFFFCIFSVKYFFACSGIKTHNNIFLSLFSTAADLSCVPLMSHLNIIFEFHSLIEKYFFQ